jgi:hypothetical protein
MALRPQQVLALPQLLRLRASRACRACRSLRSCAMAAQPLRPAVVTVGDELVMGEARWLMRLPCPLMHTQR